MFCFYGHVFSVTLNLVKLHLFSFYTVHNKKKTYSNGHTACAGMIDINTLFNKLKSTNEYMLVFLKWN